MRFGLNIIMMKLHLLLLHLLTIKTAKCTYSNFTGASAQHEIVCEFLRTNAMLVIANHTVCNVTSRNSKFDLCNEIRDVIRCNSYYEIIYISLNSYSLISTIPSSLGSLNVLTYLDLSLNSLHGTIPSTLGNLVNLQELHLSFNCLSGTIPKSFGLLTSLYSLWMINNYLTGSIPTGLGALKYLKSLRLSYNILSGTLPSALGQLSSLTFLYLSNNKLTGKLPTTLDFLEQLRLLDLSKNAFTGNIPLTNDTMSSLVTLRLSYNKLTGTIPDIFDNMFYLTVIALDHNQLSGSIPDEMFLSSYYYSFHLENNLFNGTIPYCLSYQILLNELYLSHNNLTGTLPDYFQNMFALTNIQLHSNMLTGTIPSNIASSSLTVLNLADNKLHGSVSSILCSSSLKQIYFYGNPNLGCYSACLVYMSSVFAGSVGRCEESDIICDLVESTNAVSVLSGWDCDDSGVPTTSVCNGYWEGIQCSVFNTLVSLTIPASSLRGTLPSSLGLFTYIGSIDISDNCLYGTIPSSLSLMTQLLYLYLDGNALTGALPSSLGGMSSLIEMDLHSNHLNGTIPLNFAGDVLTMLDLSHNRLLGSVPSGLCGTFLRSLSFNNNTHLGCYSSCLTSIISVQVGSLTSCGVGGTLCDVVAATNIGSKLSGWSCVAGGIPSTSVCGGYWKGVQCEDRSVVSLSLSSLSISGTLPSTLGSYSYLSLLDLSHNKLFGTFPSTMGLLSRLVHFTANSNLFNSSFPSSVCQVTSLLSLSLGQNQFKGSIPTCVGSLLKLMSLSAAGNQFTGSIPSVFNKLSNLLTLQLQSNQFEGTLPSTVTGVSLSELDVSDNRLTGSLPTTLCTSASLSSLRLANNSALTCYPECLSSLPSFVFGELSVCSTTTGSSSTTTVSNQLSTVLAKVLLSVGSIILAGLIAFIIYKLSQRTMTFVSGSGQQSRAISSAVLMDKIILSLGSHRNIYRGFYCTKHSEAVVEVDIIVERTSKSSQRQYELLFELHELNPLVFTKPLGYVKNDILDCSKLTGSYLRGGVGSLRVFSSRGAAGAATGTGDGDVVGRDTGNGNSRKPTGNRFGLGGIICEKSIQTYDAYISDSLYICDSISSVSLSSQEIVLTSPRNLYFYRKGVIATSLIHIVKTGLSKEMVFCGLTLSQLMVYDNNKHVKLADVQCFATIGDPISSLDSSMFSFDISLRRSLTFFDSSNMDVYIPLLCPEIAAAMLASAGTAGADRLTEEMAMWQLGTLLVEVFIETPFFKLLGIEDNDMSSISHLAKLHQEEIYVVIDSLLIGANNYLRRQLLKDLLQVDPSARPSSDSLLPSMYIETDDDNQLHFYISRRVPFPVIVDLLADNPEYASMPDSQGLLPVHFALTISADPMLIAHLITVHPKACLESFPPAERNRTLLQYALNKNMSDDYIRVLLPYFMPINREGGREGDRETHGFGWTSVIGHLHPPDKYVHTVACILKDYTRHIRSLAYCVDELGRTALNIATPKCKEEIIKILYFLGTYDLKHETAHQSNTCIVKIGENANTHVRVALKFMSVKESYFREVNTRKSENFSDSFVLGILQSCDGDNDEAVRQELISKGYPAYKYLIVMPEAERTLQDIIAHEHIAGKDWDKIRGLCTQLTQAVRHVHSAGLIHGDVKPLNVMRVRGRLVLIDLDACVSYKEGQYAGAKYSSAYVPPEMVHLIPSDEGGPIPVVRSYDVDEESQPVVPPDLTYSLLPAHPSYDMWSLGVTLFQICTGKPVFVIDNEDNIDDKTLIQLSDWTDSYKTELLSIVTDPMARNLLSQLLNKNPERRPSADRVLAHPFLSGKVAARLPGELPEFDVFLSYRVGADAHHVERLYDMLTAKEVKVWWDRTCLEAGKPWEEGFCNGLAKCMAFVPILSREAINSDLQPNRQNFSHLTADSPCDNVFLEHRLALEMRAMGLIELVYPVMIGDKSEGTYSNYFGSGCHPKAHPVVVAAVEEKVVEHLDRQGLGAPLGTITTVSGVLGELLKNHGGFVEGAEDTAFDNVVNKIYDMITRRRLKVSAISRFRNSVKKILQVKALTRMSDKFAEPEAEKFKKQIAKLTSENTKLMLKCAILEEDKDALELKYSIARAALVTNKESVELSDLLPLPNAAVDIS